MSHRLELRDVLVIGGITVASYCVFNFIKWRFGKRISKEWVKVGYVSQLYVHPIKSARGIAIEHGEMTPYGLKYGENRDR